MPHPLVACVVALTTWLAAQTPPITAFRGRVLDVHAHPIAGARVAWVDAPDTPAVRTDADGRYEIGSFPDRFRSLEITAPEHARVELRHSQDRAVLATATLPAAVTIIGRLRDPDGGPVVGATVTVTDMLPNHEAFVVQQKVLSDERGFFRLDAAPGSLVELAVSATGFAPARLLEVDRTSPLDLTLRPAQRCAGVVLDAGGSPVSCTVTAIAENRSASRLVTEDGRFELWVPPDLRYRVRAQASGQRIAVSEVLRGDHGELELHLGRPAEINSSAGEIVRIRAVDAASGAPIETFAAHISPQMPAQSARMLGVAGISLDPSDPTGTLEIDLGFRREAGQGAALIRAEGYADAFVPVPEAMVTDGVAVAELEVALDPERTVSGRVLDEAGEPVANAWVWGIPKGVFRASTGRQHNAVRTGDDGAFTCRSLEAGEFVLQVAPDARPCPAPLPFSTVDDDATVDVRLPAVAPIRIEWVDPPEAREWELELRPEPDTPEPQYHGEKWLRTRIDVGEPFTWERPTMSRAAVILWRVIPGRVARERRVELGIVEAGTTEPVRIDLTELHTGRVRGRVELGAQLPSARLKVVSGQSDLGIVDADGTFDVELSAGQHGIAIHDLLNRRTPLGSATVVVRPGEPAECVISAKVGSISMTVDPGTFSTTAAHRLVLRPTSGLKGPVTCDLEHVTGPIRLLLPADTYEIGLDRWLEPLTASSARGESELVGVERVELENGWEVDVTLEEPARRSDAEITGDQ